MESTRTLNGALKNITRAPGCLGGSHVMFWIAREGHRELGKTMYIIMGLLGAPGPPKQSKQVLEGHGGPRITLESFMQPRSLRAPGGIIGVIG
eukprot:149418-Pyramimonas_sp.AAC.1